MDDHANPGYHVMSDLASKVFSATTHPKDFSVALVHLGTLGMDRDVKEFEAVKATLVTQVRNPNDLIGRAQFQIFEVVQ